MEYRLMKCGHSLAEIGEMPPEKVIGFSKMYSIDEERFIMQVAVAVSKAFSGK